MTPCQNPANDPDDWYIDRKGKQYEEDDVAELAGLPELPAAEWTPENETRRQADGLRLQLAKRRRAKDRCFTECRARLACLAKAFDPDQSIPNLEPHGIFGGYSLEERRSMESTLQARRLRDPA